MLPFPSFQPENGHVLDVDPSPMVGSESHPWCRDSDQFVEAEPQPHEDVEVPLAAGRLRLGVRTRREGAVACNRTTAPPTTGRTTNHKVRALPTNHHHENVRAGSR
jgi:hypothetical protein